ncbi:hypothetical protein B0T19DRAFT_80686 [Cercophora scortea]|uniref:Uncharacterized protein n=1 Tax=Cercophora scortea TaxID=314031 RepID=A0AAE0J6Z0_9PEZI|nr:hypothetical protein B0T19DRAFT_80686 [Cercophora scortea]
MRLPLSRLQPRSVQKQRTARRNPVPPSSHGPNLAPFYLSSLAERGWFLFIYFIPLNQSSTCFDTTSTDGIQRVNEPRSVSIAPPWLQLVSSPPPSNGCVEPGENHVRRGGGLDLAAQAGDVGTDGMDGRANFDSRLIWIGIVVNLGFLFLSFCFYFVTTSSAFPRPRSPSAFLISIYLFAFCSFFTLFKVPMSRLIRKITRS